MRKKRKSKWELDWMKRYGKGQADYDEILDDCCHMTSSLETLCSKNHVITIDPFLGASVIEHGIVKRKLKFSEKSLNPIKKTEEENRGINEDILAPWRT